MILAVDDGDRVAAQDDEDLLVVSRGLGVLRDLAAGLDLDGFMPNEPSPIERRTRPQRPFVSSSSACAMVKPSPSAIRGPYAAGPRGRANVARIAPAAASCSQTGSPPRRCSDL